MPLKRHFLQRFLEVGDCLFAEIMSEHDLSSFVIFVYRYWKSIFLNKIKKKSLLRSSSSNVLEVPI